MLFAPANNQNHNNAKDVACSQLIERSHSDRDGGFMRGFEKKVLEGRKAGKEACGWDFFCFFFALIRKENEAIETLWLDDEGLWDFEGVRV